MTKHKLSRIGAYFAVFAALFAAGCKENTIINTNITPAGDSLIIDGENVPIEASTVYSHFITSIYVPGAKLVKGIGNINADPEIGQTNISLYMQVIPKQSAGYVLPDTNKIDSIVLVLPYHGFSYGDTTGTSTQQYKVYEVTESFAKADTFWDYSTKTYGDQIGSATVASATLKDSVFSEGKNQAPHLRIALTGMKQKLKDANYSSYADFFNSFKGIYIKAENVAGSKNIPYFRLSDDGAGTNYSKAGIVVYYRDDNDSVKTDLFAFNGDNCAHFNKVDNNISGTNAENDLNYLYLQSRPGLSIEVKTNGLTSQPNKLVSKAELIITEVVSANNQQKSNYYPSEYLYPYVATNDTLLSATTDATMAGLTFIGGKARKVTVNGETVNQYVVNVPREFQKALKEGREMKIRVTGVTDGYYTGAFRLKAYKSNAPKPEYNIRLNVVYSSIQ